MIKIYAIYDEKLEAYNRPFFLISDGVAIRAFQDEINNKESELSKHPEDYDLYKIGEYNEETGNITPNEPVLIGTGKALVYREENQNA